MARKVLDDLWGVTMVPREGAEPVKIPHLIDGEAYDDVASIAFLEGFEWNEILTALLSTSAGFGRYRDEIGYEQVERTRLACRRLGLKWRFEPIEGTSERVFCKAWLPQAQGA